MAKLEPYYTDGIEAGCDEAGRGCLAGPVVAAAVILPENFNHPLLDDSKKLSAKKRELLRPVIEKSAIAFGVGVLSNTEIDKVNILNASFYAMHRALEKLEIVPDHVLVDGNRFIPWEEVPFTCMIKGDARFKSIAAASVLAKTYRDEIMCDLHEKHPQYDWNKNMGYPTVKHRNAIREHGPTPFHRQSFKLLPDQLALFD